MRLFLAGCDTLEASCVALLCGHVNLLSSYFHSLWGKKVNREKLIRFSRLINTVVKKWDGDWIMDSGLFSMMFGAGKGKTYTKSDLMIYTKRYVKDMHNMQFCGNIVEMDVHKVLGMDAVYDFREYLTDHWDINKLIVVWHYEESLDGLAKMAEKYPFIAFSIPEFRLIQDKMGGAKIDQVIKYHVDFVRKINPNIKIHLLGNTQVDYMSLGGYYSSDSTTWKSSFRHGKLEMFVAGKMKTILVRDRAFSDLFEIYLPVTLRRGSILEDKFSVRVISKSEVNIRAAVRAMAVGTSYHRMNKFINNEYFGGEKVTNLWNDIYDGGVDVELDLFDKLDGLEFVS